MSSMRERIRELLVRHAPGIEPVDLREHLLRERERVRQAWEPIARETMHRLMAKQVRDTDRQILLR